MEENHFVSLESSSFSSLLTVFRRVALDREGNRCTDVVSFNQIK